MLIKKYKKRKNNGTRYFKAIVNQKHHEQGRNEFQEHKQET